MCRRTEEGWRTVGLPRHKHFVGFFNVPVQAPTRGQHSEKPLHFNRLLRRAWGYGGPILVINSRIPMGHPKCMQIYVYTITHILTPTMLGCFFFHCGTTCAALFWCYCMKYNILNQYKIKLLVINELNFAYMWHIPQSAIFLDAIIFLIVALATNIYHEKHIFGW